MSASCSTLDDLGSDNAFEPWSTGPARSPSRGSAHCRSVAQADGVVVTVRVAKPQHQAPRRLEPERVDELLAQQAHGRRAQDDDALLVQADDALVGAEIQNLAEVDVLPVRRLGVRRLFHVSRGPFS